MGRQHRARRRAGWRAAAVIVAVGTLAAGCGSVPAPTSATVAHARSPSDAPPAGSRAQAQALARQLLSRLILPRGTQDAHRRLPQALRRPDIYAGIADSVDVHELFSLPQSMPVAESFLMVHKPAGMPASGSGKGFGPSGVTSEDVSYEPRSMPAGIDDVQLVATVTPDARGGSLLRVDAQVIWFPPRTLAEHLGPSRYRTVTITVQLLNARPRTVTRRFTSPLVISGLAWQLNGLHAAAYQPWGCPMIDASYRLEFAAAHRGGPAVVVTLSGCATDSVVPGGRAQPLLWDPDDKLAAAVDRLLGLKQWP